MDPSAAVGTLDLRRALARLDPDDRALLAMRYGSGFTSDEIGRNVQARPSRPIARNAVG